MNLQPPPWECVVSSGSLAWLLQGSGTMSRLSPLRLLSDPRPPAPEDRRRLVAAGLLEGSDSGRRAVTPLGAETARTLSSPLANVTLRIWDPGAGVESCAYFPGNPVGGGGVLLNGEPDGRWRLAGTIEPDILVAAAARMIPAEPDSRVGGLDFTAHLHSAAAAVLCALLDIGRTAYRRQGFPVTGLEPGTAFSTGDIAGYLDARWGLSDFDQLITYLPATAGRGEPPLRAEIEAAIAGLASDGFIEETLTGRYLIGELLGNLVPALYGLRCGFQWQRTSLLPEGDTAVSHRVFLIGPGGAVLMLSPTAAGRVYMKLSRGEEIARFLAVEASEILPLGSAGDMEETPPAACSGCHAPVRQGARFCTRCGQSLASPSPPSVQPDVCPHCGRKIRLHARFCTNCGTPILP